MYFCICNVKHLHVHIHDCTHTLTKKVHRETNRMLLRHNSPSFILMPSSLHPSFYRNHMRKDKKPLFLPTSLLVKHFYVYVSYLYVDMWLESGRFMLNAAGYGVGLFACSCMSLLSSSSHVNTFIRLHS